MAQSRRSPHRGTGGRVRRWLAGLVLVVAAAGTGAVGTAASLAVTGAPAGAQPIGDCSTTSGVVVVVDFAHWGGTVERGCAADPSAGSTTGLRALHTAGFSTAGVSAYGTAFICRIDTKPTPTQTSCAKIPPASAYWSYWHAAGQTTWSYSTAGVATYRPPPGSVTAWVFGGTTDTGTSGTGRPPFTPTQVRATNTAPAGGGGGATTTTTPATTTTTAGSSGPSPVGGMGSTSPPAGGQSSGGGPPSGSGGAGTSASGGSGGGSSATPTTTLPAGGGGSGPTTTTSPGAGGGGTSSTGKDDRSGGGSRDGKRAGAGPRIVDVDPASARRASPSGSPLPLVLGIVVVAALAAGGGMVAWRRRRAGEGTAG